MAKKKKKKRKGNRVILKASIKGWNAPMTALTPKCGISALLLFAGFLNK